MGAVTGHFALYATDTRGARRAIELERHLDQADLFVDRNVSVSLPDFACLFQRSVQDLLSTNLDHYECHIVFLRSGQSWWQMAGFFPSNNDYHRVLVMVVDELAGVCLPVYGGHEAGRQHQLTEQVAWMLGVQSVLSLPGSPGDIWQFLLTLGLRHGWVLEPASYAAFQCVVTALCQKQSVAWVQSSGRLPCLPKVRGWSDCLVHHASLETVNPDAYNALVLVSDQQITDTMHTKYQDKVVVWRPKSLVVGVWCHRDTPLEVVGQGLVQFLDDNGLSIDSVRYLAGLDLQRHHPALNDFGIIHDIPLLTYGIDELLTADRSRSVIQVKGLWENGRFSVAEAAARHCSGASTVLIPESTFCLQAGGPSVKMVICRIPDSHGLAALTDSQDKKKTVMDGVVRDQIVVCSGSHCSRAGSCHWLADRVRRLAREMKLDQGERQIQVAASVCCIACRYKNSAVIHESLAENEHPVNDGVRLRGVQSLSSSQWQKILRAVKQRRPLRNLLASSQLVPTGGE